MGVVGQGCVQVRARLERSRWSEQWFFLKRWRLLARRKGGFIVLFKVEDSL